MGRRFGKIVLIIMIAAFLLLLARYFILGFLSAERQKAEIAEEKARVSRIKEKVEAKPVLRLNREIHAEYERLTKDVIDPNEKQRILLEIMARHKDELDAASKENAAKHPPPSLVPQNMLDHVSSPPQTDSVELE